MGERIAQSGLFDRIYICSLDTPRFAGLSRLKRVFEPYGDITVRTYDTGAGAYTAMESELNGHFGFAAGSLYLVGEVRAFLFERGGHSD